jgi:CxxC motif-containing protein (DUF1111 family)
VRLPLAVGVLFVALSLTTLLSSTEAKDKLDWASAERLGGTFTVYSFGESPFNRAAPFLTLEERRTFSDGSSAFRTDRETAGPLADSNARSCDACHFRNGRGLAHMGAIDQTGFSVAAPVFRQPLENKKDVAKLSGVAWRTERTAVLSDGTRVELVVPVAIIDGEERPADLRNAPGVYGLGLLEAVPDSAIRQLAETRPYAAFGIAGVVQASTTEGRVGRFGWKGTFGSLETQVQNAMVHELGMTDPVSQSPDSGRFGELHAKLTNYMRLLAVPARRVASAETERGAEIFGEIGCAMCHTPSWQTGNSADVSEKHRKQVIHPFTDFLLHDMGEGLRDSNGNALSRLWKTPPLWGIGVQASVSDKGGFLHDGRARNLLEVVLWHGGEAAETIHNFEALPPDERQQLLAFLSSL